MLHRLMRRGRALLLLSCVYAAAACGDDATGPDFDRSLGVDLDVMTRTASGLYILDVTAGTGAEAVAGANATVRYSGWLTSGARFDAGTYTFRLGQRQAIAGFDEGVMGMRVGGTRRLVIPPHLGYGERGQGPIPPNAHLLFEVELLSVSP